MTDMQAALMQGTAPISTTLDVGHSSTAVGGGAPPTDKQPPAPPAKPETPADTMRAELARQREEDAKDADKLKGEGDQAAKDAKAKLEDAEKAPKDGKTPDLDKTKTDANAKAAEPADKAEKSDADKLAAEREGDKSRPSEGQKRNDPPARFLPKAKEAWVNVPHSVREDVHRMEQEHEAEVTKYKASNERYESIRPFDELAKTNGRDLRDSLTKINEIENVMKRSPIAGLEMILREIGPRKPDGSAISLYDVAQYVSKQTPEQFQQTQQQISAHQEQQKNQSQAQAANQEVETLRNENARLMYIAPFVASHPRYHELEGAIAGILKGGLVPASLSPADKLAAAYDMAERLNPVSKSDALQVADAPVAAKAAPADDAGSKSVRGAPTGGSDPDDDGDDVTDIGKLLRREARKLA